MRFATRNPHVRHTRPLLSRRIEAGALTGIVLVIAWKAFIPFLVAVFGGHHGE